MIDFRLACGIIKDSVSALQLGRDMGLQPDDGGNCNCPRHRDKTPSLKLYAGTGSGRGSGFYCYSCHHGGDVIRLYMDVVGAGYGEAIYQINNLYKLGLDSAAHTPTTDERLRELAPRIAERAALQSTAASVKQQLLELIWSLSGSLDKYPVAGIDDPHGGIKANLNCALSILRETADEITPLLRCGG